MAGTGWVKEHRGARRKSLSESEQLCVRYFAAFSAVHWMIAIIAGVVAASPEPKARSQVDTRILGSTGEGDAIEVTDHAAKIEQHKVKMFRHCTTLSREPLGLQPSSIERKPFGYTVKPANMPVLAASVEAASRAAQIRRYEAVRRLGV